MKLQIWVPALPKLPNRLLGAPWYMRAAEARKWKRLVGDALTEWRHAGSWFVPPETFKKARITLTRCSPRQCDFDGLVGSFKQVIDSLVHHGVIEGDETGKVQCEYRWEKTPKAKQGIKVEVESVE